ncbi:hypothetical protein PBRA_003964 [Plasmodiophora brassicae]|uniref:Bifunctional lysine-specific demethylase and histidyl-hydroxylase n=1 Tax=Plasmodiophora brassicae TaxID=37360 RepID=A0A0G4IJ20_PLABS|nr:hypothetical protein PBRA_003964 [Plasmodiophora brassicae]
MVSGVDFLMSRRTRLKDGEYWSTMLPIPVPDFTSIYKAFSLGGFTLIVNRAHRRWRPIASICELVGRTIASFPINANLYLTPKLAQGFEAHQDWMEVIVIQLEGMKHWRLYPDFPSVRLPFPEMIVKPSSSSLTKERALDLTLSPGDVLYIPAGVVHEASTGTTDTISLHVTIGIEIHPVDTWLGLMLSAVRFMSNAMSRPTLLCLALYEVAVRPESAPLRRAIPHGDWIAGQHSMVFSYFKDLLTDTLADVAIERALLIRRDTVNAQVVTCLEPWPTCDDSVSCNDDFESDKQTLRSITAISFNDVTSSYVESARHRQRSKSAQTNRELERVAERLSLYVESKVQPKAELYTSSGPLVDSRKPAGRVRSISEAQYCRC